MLIPSLTDIGSGDASDGTLDLQAKEFLCISELPQHQMLIPSPADIESGHAPDEKLYLC